MAHPRSHARSESAERFREEGRYFAAKENALRRTLSEEGILEADEGRHTATIRADGELHRVLRLRREPWQRLWEAQ